MRPLYTQEKISWKGGNAGLWYDKFCNQWEPDWSGLGDDGKKEWIKTVTGKVGHQSQLETTNTRLADFLKAHNQQPLFFKNTYTFVTGLGREHPVENGFAWHHTLGVPYLPGSSVKGMVRAWAKQWDPKPDEEINRIFGPKEGDLRVGSVIFLDALPTCPVELQADIMTPHYGPYYQDDKGQTPPADWHSPTPILFLAVSKEQSFVFGLLPRREKDRADCQQVENWLRDALCWIGAGAKTAVGYGRFERDEEYQSTTAAKAEAQVISIKKAIQNLRGAQDRNRLPEIVANIAQLQDLQDRKVCATMLLQWFKQHRKNKKLKELLNSDKPWTKQLKSWI